MFSVSKKKTVAYYIICTLQYLHVHELYVTHSTDVVQVNAYTIQVVIFAGKNLWKSFKLSCTCIYLHTSWIAYTLWRHINISRTLNVAHLISLQKKKKMQCTQCMYIADAGLWIIYKFYHQFYDVVLRNKNSWYCINLHTFVFSSELKKFLMICLGILWITEYSNFNVKTSCFNINVHTVQILYYFFILDIVWICFSNWHRRIETMYTETSWVC